MKRTLIVSLLTAIAIVSLFIPTPSIAQSMSTVQKGTPLNASSDPITGFTALTIPTITWSAASTAVRMPALPAGTIAVTAICSGTVNYGDSTVKDDAVGAYPSLTDEQEKTFIIYPNTVQPDIWFVPTATGSTVNVVRFIAHTQK